MQALVKGCSEGKHGLHLFMNESPPQSEQSVLFSDLIAEVHPPSKSNPNIRYTTRAIKKDGMIIYECDCPGRRINLKCWHIRDLARLIEGAELFEEPEINPYKEILDLITNARMSNSKIAWASLQEHLSESRKAVFEAIRAFPGITRQDICPKLRMPINSVSGRVNDLMRLGLIYEGESVTNARTGMPNATLWAISEVE